MTDFRVLCSVLIDDLELCDWPCKLKKTIRDDIDRARAALAEPEPEGPTDEELESVARAAEIQNMKEQGGLTANDANGVAAQLQLQRLAGLRAVLARWSSPAPQPVPVSDRQQQIEDLAADAVSALCYIEQSHGRLYGIGWDRVYEKADRLLPAHALPVPEANNG